MSGHPTSARRCVERAVPETSASLLREPTRTVWETLRKPSRISKPTPSAVLVANLTTASGESSTRQLLTIWGPTHRVLVLGSACRMSSQVNPVVLDARPFTDGDFRPGLSTSPRGSQRNRCSTRLNLLITAPRPDRLPQIGRIDVLSGPSHVIHFFWPLLRRWSPISIRM